MNEMNILTVNGEQYEVADKTAREGITGKADKAYVDKTFAPAIPVTMTGTVASTDMVSPVEHDIKCKVSGVDDPTAVTVKRYATNIMPKKFYTVDSWFVFGQNSENDEETFLVKGYTYYFFYKFGTENAKDSKLYAANRNGQGKFLGLLDNSGRITFTFSEETGYYRLNNWKSNYRAKSDDFVNWQLSYVDIPGQPYIEPQVFHPNADGTVDGMVSAFPSFAVVCDAPKVNIEVAYNADTKKYIDSKSSTAPNILTVNTTAGATVTATDGITSLKETATDGKAEFTIPEAGEWTATAEKDGESSKPVTVDVTDNFTADAPIIPKAKIYGAQWDGTANTKWARTDAAVGFTDPNPAVNNGTGSSPFDDIMPWAGMTRVSDPVAGELVKIPKFYYKWTKVGNGLKLQISEKKPDGTWFTSPAHMDRGDGHGERDVVYVGRYHCGSDYKSKTGVLPKVNITRATARTGIHALGEDIWQWDWHTRMTIWMLYLVEFADWDSQKVIGYGCGRGLGYQVENVGKSDTMGYCTGTPYATKSTYGVGVQYRSIEGLWDNCYDSVDGCYAHISGLNIINNPIDFSDNANGTSAGIPVKGYPSKFEVKKVNGLQMIIPSEANGNTNTYTCDYWGFNSDYPCLCYGGSNDNNTLMSGIWGNVSHREVDGDMTTSTRLMKLPNA